MMCHARSAWWLETKSYARIVPPLPRFTRQPQKEKMFLAFRICARPIFSENGKDIFLFGVLPSKYSGSAWGFNTDSAKRKSFFLGERFFRFASTDFPPAGGVWGGMRAGIPIRFFGKIFAATNSIYGIIPPY